MKQKERFRFYYEDAYTGCTTDFDIVAYSMKQACFFAHDYQRVLGCYYHIAGPSCSSPAPASMPLGVHGCDDFRNYKD